MATIYYGLSGEGRGHATRARTLIESLRKQHKLVVFAPDLAHAMLEPIYRGTEVRVEPIAGLQFSYNQTGRVRLLGTLATNVSYLRQMNERVGQLLPHFERDKPDLVLADFEPLLPRAARLCGVPFVSFDHQHYLVVNDLSSLPLALRQQAALAAPVVRALYNWQVETVVSSFYNPPLKPGLTNVSQIGVLLRPELMRMRPERHGHLLVYMRRHPAPGLFDALTATGLPVKLYGLGQRPREGNISFLEVDEQRFMEDLATCEAVVSTAGNQLVGEALHLRKPVLAIPEPHNFEQSINGHFLQASGAGRTLTRAICVRDMLSFLQDLDVFRNRIVSRSVCGNQQAVDVVSRLLGADRLAVGRVVRASEPYGVHSPVGFSRPIAPPFGLVSELPFAMAEQASGANFGAAARVEDRQRSRPFLKQPKGAGAVAMAMQNQVTATG